MQSNICGNCDYCNKNRTNNKGQLRCERFSDYVNIDGSCPAYFSRNKEDFYNKLLSVIEKGGEG